MGDGRLLVIGGCAANSCDALQSSNEFYDIAQRRFRPAPPMRTARVSHATAALPDGGLLLVGAWMRPCWRWAMGASWWRAARPA